MGRPRIYDSVEDLEKKVDEYLAENEGKKLSVSGLALHLGFDSKDTLYGYRDRQEFSYPIKKALLYIEKYHEDRLSENAVTGSIFALKNIAGWKDKTETGFTDSSGKDVSPVKIYIPDNGRDKTTEGVSGESSL